MQSFNKNSKQRRYIRYEIEQDALLTAEEWLSIECVILDFCTHGLFLEFKASHPEIQLNKTIKIQFTIELDHQSTNFSIDAQVVHVAPNGLGVIIDNMPLAAFNALKKQATLPAVTPRNLDDTTPKKASIKNFKRSFKHALTENLSQLMFEFFGVMGDYLEKVNQQAEYFPNQFALDDIASTISFNQESLTSEFCNSVICQVNFISETDPKKEDINSFDRSLSLVEKEDFEDWLNMSYIIRKLSNYYEDKINKITRELSRIYGHSNSIINNPIDPSVLCDSFRDIIIALDLGVKTNKALYTSFGQFLLESLPDFYEQANSFLIAQESAEKIVPQHPLPDQSGQLSADPGNFHRQQQVPVLHDYFSSYDEAPQQLSLEPITKVTAKLLNILKDLDSTSNLNKQTLSDAGDDLLPQDDFYFDQNEIVTALAQLQNETDNSDIHQNYSELQAKLTNKLKLLSTQSKLFSSRDVNHLEVYGKFFETLFNDFDFSSDLKSFIESMHIPMLSLSLQGNDFLDSDTHPATKILNQLSVLDAALKGNKIVQNKKIKNALDEIAARVSREADTNPLVFSEAEQELEALTKQISKAIDSRTRHIIETYQGQQKLEAARQTIQLEIDKRIAGKPVPTVIPLLLDSGWRHLLVYAELNKEKHKEEKQVYLKVIDDLMFWLYEQDAMLKLQANSIQTTIDFIEDRLSSAATSVFDRKQVVEELTALLLGVGNPKVRKKIETVEFTPQKSDDNPERLEVDDHWVAIVDQLIIDDWLTIKQESDAFVSMKLVWIGNVPQMYVFVDRVGLNKLEFSKTELAELFRTGAASKTENLDAPLTERASNTMVQKMHEKLIFTATHDPETDLFTRDEFIKQLKIEMTKISDAQHMLCHVEVLDFRLITNICGLAGGTELLKSVSQLMKEQLRDCDLFARLGDSSFAILFKDCSIDEANELSHGLIKLISGSHFNWQDKNFAISVCMGLSPFGNDCLDVHQILQQADAASLSAERTGHNRVLTFAINNENLKQQQKLFEWIGHIDTIFSQDRLFSRCQMIASIDKSSNKHQHYEILLGIKDEEGNIIPPDHFIPAVERCKRMPEIDQWVINNVFSWIDNNKDCFESIDGFSINLSGQSINSEVFLGFLNQRLTSCDFPLDKIVFEITETVASENLFFTQKFIHKIKEFGCKFSLDDFGSGYSSYSYLKNLNADYLKIDGAFVKDIVNNKADYAIVKSMNEIAHSLGLKTIAEYVENAEIQVVLTEIGVNYGQGYHIHKPMPLKDLVIQLPSEDLYFFEDNSFWDI